MPTLDYQSIYSQLAKPEVLNYEETKLKEMADDISKQISAEMKKSGEEQRKFNIVLTIIGLLTLLFTAYGVFFK